ncbi:carboxyl-terminal processing protease CtpC [Synechococcus elongatus]|uniref:Carboxyl-terminal-processing protease n=2 Tax=Synechococcus elongatus TaxID=32046 RepID=Q31QC5_SYNE7|nr:carboxyl-terminal processing protease CtpC [Synechococcus elongatus]ABB56744.1 C-terminal processing peptidase-2. Serine peptidase. MEROPS family S41A [Synechococcus elongatus PCC 7942 = FACHB-805]AJD58715.1 peptidase S41 [Synechococcus elongatus UTEX 2973]MBD2588604.1 S41 family peptidase [Synechococcus elongatus FACHB-242]MBD2689807.1 S41 family peptidase [Synechococcus elongatus FACHB-1061]MBD2708414.1 S41 family peptidase [Synechococcus elongatus PCC 7942 = FACHB-805]
MAFSNRKLIAGICASAIATVAVVGAGNHWARGQALFQESPKEIIDEVWQVVDRNYVDSVGTFDRNKWRQLRREYLARNYKTREEAYSAVKEMLKTLGDPYTRFMDPDEFKDMQIDTSGELTGVGIQLSQDPDTKELIVVSPIEGSPAAAAGIRSRDVIVKIDQKTTQGMSSDEAVKLIRGPVGSKITLTIRREKETIAFPIVRERIEIHSVSARVQESPTGPVGYIRLRQFSANSAPEMRQAIKDLEAKNVKGYVLDLRSNPGGLLYASIDIARMWLPKGVIVSTKDRSGISEQASANNRALTDKPLVVLVDGGSASASEILSGALQDNNRAVLIGSKTFGKGLVQSVRPLGDGSGLAVTIAKYLTPSGRDINKQGIEPNIVAELTDAQREDLSKNQDQIGTASDPQFQSALKVLTQQIATASNK